ncbi:MAG: hypothetical protein FWC48_01510 [Actinomycetia bacterium]|nr:hypothetical protein [Actinomycetes bacterium]
MRKSALTRILALLCSGMLVIGLLPLAAQSAAATPTEGAVSYLAADGTKASPTGPDIDPFLSGTASHVSGSKVASDLNASDETTVTLSFPSADFVPSYDIVLVTDGTQSFADTAPAARQMIADLAGEVSARPNMNVKVGAVAYGTVAYSSFAPGTGLVNGTVWNMLQTAFRTGNWSSVPGGVPAAAAPMIGQMVPLGNGWPNDSLPAGGDAVGAKDLLGGLQPLNATTEPTLSSAISLNGSRLAAEYLLAYASYTNSAPYTGTYMGVGFQGYTMNNPVIGTNLEAGIKSGQALLDGDTTTPAANKYLVILTDGGTYYWNSNTSDDPHQQMTGALYNANGPAQTYSHGAHVYAQLSQVHNDWAQGPRALYATGTVKPTPTGATAAEYQSFLTAPFGGATLPPTTDQTSQISIEDFQTNMSNQAWAAAAGLTTDYANTATYPYISLEKGTAHAATALQSAVSNNPLENVFLLGSQYAAWSDDELSISNGFLNWSKNLVGAQNYYPISPASTTADIQGALNDIQGQLLYVIDHGTLTDTIGSEFDLVLGGASIAPSDVTLTLSGTPLAVVVDPSDPNQLDFGTPDTGTGLYPYTVRYVPGAAEKLVLTINVPVETSEPLQLTYHLKLTRQTTPSGWHTGVKLNESAIVEYTSTDGSTGTTSFPIPVTQYYVPAEEPHVPPVEPKKPTPVTPKPAPLGLPSTGDPSAPGYAFIALLAGAALVLVSLRRRRLS